MATVSLLTNFVANLRTACDRSGMTQRELARRSGVHYVTINRILQGNVDPSVRICEALAIAAGITEERIFRNPSKR